MSNQVSVNTTNNIVTVTDNASSRVVTVVTAGPKGDKGDTGATGPAGSGSVDTGSLLQNSEFYSYTSSNDTRLNLIEQATGSFLTSSDTGSFVLNSQTGSFLTANDTGSFVLNSQTGSFLTANDTGSLLLSSEFYAYTQSHLDAATATFTNVFTQLNSLTSKTGSLESDISDISNELTIVSSSVSGLEAQAEIEKLRTDDLVVSASRTSTVSASFANDLVFDSNKIIRLPSTGSGAVSMSLNETGSILGNVILSEISASAIYHPPTNFKTLSGTFNTGSLNYIYYHYIGNSTVLLTISQEQ